MRGSNCKNMRAVTVSPPVYITLTIALNHRIAVISCCFCLQYISLWSPLGSSVGCLLKRSYAGACISDIVCEKPWRWVSRWVSPSRDSRANFAGMARLIPETKIIEQFGSIQWLFISFNTPFSPTHIPPSVIAYTAYLRWTNRPHISRVQLTFLDILIYFLSMMRIRV